MKHTRCIGRFHVSLFAGDDLGAQAEALLDKLVELDRRGTPIADGTKVEFGWSTLTLRSEGDDDLIVSEPDFERAPLDDYVSSVDGTLRVLTEQMAVAQRIGVEPVAAHYLDKVVIAKGALDERRIYLERRSQTGNGDSGWYVGKVEDKNSGKGLSDLESIRVYDVFRRRRRLMRMLALPPGYLVVFDGDRVEAVLNPRNQDVWSKS